MKLYKGSQVIIIIIIVIISIALEWKFFSMQMHDELAYTIYGIGVIILSFIAIYNVYILKKVFSNIFYVRKYRTKNGFGMKKIIEPLNVDYLVMSTTFYYSFCEYIEAELDMNIIDSEYMFFTIYEDEKLVLYYEPRTSIKKIMEAISNE